MTFSKKVKFKPVALICGISGQDGTYLAQFLLEKGYRVYGSSRDAQMNPFNNLTKLGILKQVKTLSMDFNFSPTFLTAAPASV